ncbi:unnamed protein product [Nippostrongylus brasiliensis]|uniref:V-SNARE domain-containing protein n=1 Tax=Nippostrongylus brasiliensis TaxID=27835 RepID=A0A0N4YB89_NIPBR|nr:unnamed protein product [Nippostrongylus brasiliensis]
MESTSNGGAIEPGQKLTASEEASDQARIADLRGLSDNLEMLEGDMMADEVEEEFQRLCEVDTKLATGAEGPADIEGSTRSTRTELKWKNEVHMLQEGTDSMHRRTAEEAERDTAMHRQLEDQKNITSCSCFLSLYVLVKMADKFLYTIPAGCAVNTVYSG